MTGTIKPDSYTPAMPIQIDIYSDYVCPYCVLFEVVLAEAGRDLDLQLNWKPVELRPWPNDTLRPEDNYLPDAWRRSVYPLAEQLNVPLKLPSISPQPYSRLAHEGYQFAERAGKANEYNQRVFSAFFQDDLDIGDLDVLTRLAEEVGLDAGAFRAALEAGEFSAAHSEALLEAAARGVHSVPSVWVNGQPLPLTYDAVALRSLLRLSV
jgi:predicted DsbA family dithiol-disulfide isomerase